MPGKLFVITGPSGVGKSSVARELLKMRPSLARLVTCTTRRPRENETDGVDYHFISQSEFTDMIDRGEMFEWDFHYGHYYGNREQDVIDLLQSGRDVLMVLDVKGAKTVKEKRPDANLIFIQAESPEILMERLEKRDKGKTVNLEERRDALEAEMKFCEECEFMVVNEENRLNETVEKISKYMSSY